MGVPNSAAKLRFPELRFAAGRLQRVLPNWKLPDQGGHVLTSTRAQQPPKTRAFTDFLRLRFGDPPDWESGLAVPGPTQPLG